MLPFVDSNPQSLSLLRDFINEVPLCTCSSDLKMYLLIKCEKILFCLCMLSFDQMWGRIQNQIAHEVALLARTSGQCMVSLAQVPAYCRFYMVGTWGFE